VFAVDRSFAARFKEKAHRLNTKYLNRQVIEKLSEIKQIFQQFQQLLCHLARTCPYVGDDRSEQRG
jgi:hypothetical protein